MRFGLMMMMGMLASAPLAAQPLPRDTVRVEMTRLAWMDECSPVGDYVLDSQAALDSLRRYPQCAYLPARMELDEHVRVGVNTTADCNARTALAAYRSDSLRVLRVTLVHRGGGCRGLRTGYRWVEVPRPPAGYRVELGVWDLPSSHDVFDRFAPDSVLDGLDRPAWLSPGRSALAGEVPAGVAAIPFEVVDMGSCRASGMVVLDSREALARLRQRRDCAHLPARMDFGEHVLVGISAFTDCHARLELGAWRIDAERKVMVTSDWTDGGCRGMRMQYRWVRLPRPPEGYTIGGGRVPWTAAGGQAEAVDMWPQKAPGDRCSPADGFVLDGPEALARLRSSPGCAELSADDVDLFGRVLVRVILYGSCGRVGTSLSARRYDAERVMRLYAVWVDAMCRSVSHEARWVAVARPPEGYRVELVRRRVQRDDG